MHNVGVWERGMRSSSNMDGMREPQAAAFSCIGQQPAAAAAAFTHNHNNNKNTCIEVERRASLSP